jgi:restriction system protein
MNLLDGAAMVLEHAGLPMKASAITSKLLAEGLWTSQGKTPAATVEARIAVDIKKRGVMSRFTRVSPGTFALNPVLPLGDESGMPREGSTIPGAMPAQSDPPPRLSFTDAAEHILRGQAGGQPLHYRDITQRALAESLIATAGKTPEATMYAQIIVETARRNRRGQTPRFVRLGKGMIGLTEWTPAGLTKEIAAHNEEVKRQLLEQVLDLTAAGFETLAGTLLTSMGFEDVVVTKVSGDGGIDARAVLVVGDAIRIRMAIQAKKWKANVRSPVVQQVRGSLGAHDRGLIISTGGYSLGARAEAARPDAPPVALLNGQQLIDLLVEYRIGIKAQPHELLSLVSFSAAQMTDTLLEPA